MPYPRYPKDIILRDKTEVVLRNLEPGDHADLVRFYKELESSFKWYLKQDPTDPGVIERWIDRHREGKAFSIVAEHEKRIVAHASVILRPYGARKHIGRLRVTVDTDFRRKGLGTWMIFDLIKRSMEMGLERIRIDFVVGIDDQAIKAVRKLDFVKEGLLRDYIRDEDGNYHDYQIMIKQLHKDWSDF